MKLTKYRWGILGIILIVATILMCVLLFGKDNELTKEMKQQLKQDSSTVKAFVENIGTSDAESMMLSMYPIETYNEDVFLKYIPEKADILKVSFDNGKQLVQVLETILDQPHTLNKVYLGIHKEGLKLDDTFGLKLSYHSGFSKIGKSWEEILLAIAKEHPEIQFRMMLYYPKISTLTAMDEEQLSELLDWYVYMANLLLGTEECKNIQIYMPGAEEWIIANEGNYQDDYNLNAEAASELETLALCACLYQVYPENIHQKNEQLRSLIQKYQENPLTSIGQEAYTYVFFGDSVIGNFSGSLSIPGAVASLTGAKTINCGYGGLAATTESAKHPGLKGVLDVLLAEEGSRDVTKLKNENVQQGITEFWNAEIPKNSDKLKFFISFGINDYAGAHPIENKFMNERCFKGALYYASKTLKEAYPNAEVILMTPNRIGIGEFGTVPILEGGLPYQNYIDAIFEVAEEENLPVVDIYNDFEITEENAGDYIPDMCHPNYYARFKIGEIIRKYMSGLQSE